MRGLFLLGTVEKLEQSYNETIVALIHSVEARDPYTQGHSQRVAQMAALIGEALRLPPETVRTLHQSGLLHDVGKIGVPDAILNKPARLTDEEYAIMKGHPARGEAMIRGIPSLLGTLPGIRSHHERWDGSGYPDGLAREAIPLQGRILAVADVYDAMTSGRAYRAPFNREVVLDELRSSAGTRYDPKVSGRSWTRGATRPPARAADGRSQVSAATTTVGCGSNSSTKRWSRRKIRAAHRYADRRLNGGKR